MEKVAKKYENITILTDFDDAGESIGKKLTQLMENRGVKVERFYRKNFKRLLKETGLTTLESIYKLKRDLFLS